MTSQKTPHHLQPDPHKLRDLHVERLHLMRIERNHCAVMDDNTPECQLYRAVVAELRRRGEHIPDPGDLLGDRR